jgi:hypothetical protein
MFAWFPQPSRRKRAQKLLGATLLAFLTTLAGLAHAGPAATPSKITLEGTLEVLHEDRPEGGRYHYFLQSGGRRFQLRVKDDNDGHGHSHDDHQTGDRVRVRGQQIGETLALDGAGSSSIETLSYVLPNTFGPQKTLVLLVNFQDNPSQPYTTAFAEDVVFNTTSNFHYENSYQQTWLTGDVRGWFTLPMSGATCDFNAIYFAARQAATDNGINLAAYNRFIYAFPQTNSCGWWGLGTVGGNPSHAWINGSLQLRVVGHETGHNLGLYHSHALECGSVTITSAGCSPIEYGDTVDIMGTSAGHYNAYQKEWLGWLGYGASPPLTTASTEGIYTIDDYETVGSNPKAIKVLKAVNSSTGARDWYYIEHRQAVGFDSDLAGDTNVLSGVIIHSGSEASGDTSYLLDMTPATSSWFDPALGVGQTFQDPDSGVTITVLSADSAGATVSVSYTAPQCVPANPSVALSSGGAGVQAGTPVAYSLTITNNDVGCAAANFSLQPSLPQGWTTNLAGSAVTLAAGASTTISLQVTSAASASSGSYGITVIATHSDNGNLFASASTTYTVASSQGGGSSVNVSLVRPPAAAYPRKKAVPLVAHVTSSGRPVGGAFVSFTITKPDGSIVSASYKTKKNGQVSFKYKTTMLDPIGTYQAAAGTSVAGTSSIAGLVTTSFVVQ